MTYPLGILEAANPKLYLATHSFLFYTRVPCDAWYFCNLFKRKGPTQRLKTAKMSIFTAILDPKSQVLAPIFGQLFFLQNMGLWGVQSVAMWWLVLMQPFQTQGTHSAAHYGQKNWVCIRNRHYRANPGDPLSCSKRFGVQNGRKIEFLAVLSLWVGPLHLKRLRKDHRYGHPTCLYFEEKKMAENKVPRIGIWGRKWP